MNYALCTLSHGDHSPADALDSFYAHVQPHTKKIISHHDVPQEGFCGATRRLWQRAAGMDVDYVFWLEHDFRFTRTVDLGVMADLLEDPEIAQVTLLRQAVNKTERKAGGIVEANPEAFTDMGGWLEHTRYFSTNPSLMRRDFMQQHTFGDDRHRLPQDIRCEGLFGMALIEQGYRFAVMGEGEPWVEHVGWRDGTGY